MLKDLISDLEVWFRVYRQSIATHSNKIPAEEIAETGEWDFFVKQGVYYVN